MLIYLSASPPKKKRGKGGIGWVSNLLLFSLQYLTSDSIPHLEHLLTHYIEIATGNTSVQKFTLISFSCSSVTSPSEGNNRAMGLWQSCKNVGSVLRHGIGRTRLPLPGHRGERSSPVPPEHTSDEASMGRCRREPGLSPQIKQELATK